MTAETVAAARPPTQAGNGRPALPKTKAQTLRSYRVADFPALTGREEEWRFTPLKRLRGLATADAAVDTAPAPRYEYDELPAGVTVSTLDPGDPAVRAAEAGLVPFDRISALAYGAASAVTLIEVRAADGPQPPALVRVVATDPARLSFARTLVKVGRFAEAALVLHQVGSGTLADNLEVLVADGARLTLVTVADWSPDAVQAQHVKFRLGRDARVSHVQVTVGGDLVRQYTSVDYADRGGEAELYGLYFAHARQHLEHRLLVDHAVPDCRSYVAYRGALQDAGTQTVWVGDVLIQTTATGTDTYEINRNLVLTDGAQAHSVPNLEIETGEVVGAGHASTTGRFDDEQLFYLMARGIPETEARKLVVRGFFGELLGRVPVAALREQLAGAIEARLETVRA